MALFNRKQNKFINLMPRTVSDDGQERGAIIDEKRISEANDIFSRYRAAKEPFENRVISDELWYELRHWEAIRRGQKGKPDGAPEPEPASAWLFNCIINKHADAMDNFPCPVVLPREMSDEGSAKMLSDVLPVVLERNDFEETYSRNWDGKLKHGTAIYGVFWNPDKENGIGDIDIKKIDPLRIYWQPGIDDIQDSKNVFLVDLVDTETLETQYPELKGKLGGSPIAVKQYLHNDDTDFANKSVVVDWYYKVKRDGREILHYVKYCNSYVLYSSEDDDRYAENGFYNHGQYPFVFDVLFHEEGTPIGFGYVAICKDPQLYIDKMQANIIENSLINTRVRYFASKSLNINEDDLVNTNKAVVEFTGSIDDSKLREIKGSPLDGIYFSVLQAKIEEMKDTAGNRDVNSGGTGSGVTAAAAIAALQEAGNKLSRDMIAASYRSYVKIASLSIELMRQFYTVERSFRIVGEKGYEYASFSNRGIRPQISGMVDGREMYRLPVFDLKIKAQKKNPFSRAEQNELSKELYSIGFFNPERAQEALIALELMEFEGKDKVLAKVREGQTLFSMLQILEQRVVQLQNAIGISTAGAEAANPTRASRQAGTKAESKGYGEAIKENATADVNNPGNGASV